MSKCIIKLEISASGVDSRTLQNMAHALEVVIRAIVNAWLAFRDSAVTPSRAFGLERSLLPLVREVGRVVLQVAMQEGEPSRVEEVQPRISVGLCREYRLAKNSRTPLPIDTRFGRITVQRWAYKSLFAGEPGLFPFDLRWGLAAGVSQGLAERIGHQASDQTQGELRAELLAECGVSISVKRLRKAVGNVAAQVAPVMRAARVARVIALMKEAVAGGGPHRITMSLGRAGCNVPMRGKSPFKVAAAATISIHDGHGKRRGTVYLGQMPQANQVALTQELNEIWQDVLREWHQECPAQQLPRLVYLTDSGHQEVDYWKQLRNSRHPVTKVRLKWIRVADFYHACQYISKMADALFDDEEQRKCWLREMRRLMRDAPRGARRVLQSAAAHRSHRVRLRDQDLEAYTSGFNYLASRLKYMQYDRCQSSGLPIGSGVTEAGCKTLFTQRFKRSGMKWTNAGAHPILQIRTLALSHIWPSTYTASLTILDQQVAALPPHAIQRSSSKNSQNAL